MSTTTQPSSFEAFMASNDGRAMRVAFCLVPIAAGVLNLCPVAPIWGGHFIGAK